MAQKQFEGPGNRGSATFGSGFRAGLSQSIADLGYLLRPLLPNKYREVVGRRVETAHNRVTELFNEGGERVRLGVMMGLAADSTILAVVGSSTLVLLANMIRP